MNESENRNKVLLTYATHNKLTHNITACLNLYSVHCVSFVSALKLQCVLHESTLFLFRNDTLKVTTREYWLIHNND